MCTVEEGMMVSIVFKLGVEVVVREMVVQKIGAALRQLLAFVGGYHLRNWLKNFR